MAIEAMASAQLGDEQHATKLIDILLCDNDVRLGLGLNHECPIARRRPETMPLSVNVLEYLERTTLDRLRYLDLATFKFAHALFMRREKRMLATLASSELLFKEVRFLRDERFSEVPAKKRSKTLDLVVWYTPVVLRFGPARGRNQTDCRDFQVVMILTGALGTAQWVRAPQLAEAFKGNAYFATDPAKERWLTHIISSSHIKVSMIDAGVRGRLRAAYRGSGDLSRDELCFELFRETEKTRHKYDPPRETRTISDDLASQLINAFRAPVNEYLARCDATGAAK
jgi:hypothetical protein